MNIKCYRTGTAMLLAALINRGKCVQAFKGADVNGHSSITFTGRGCMARNRCLTTVKTVIDAGAHVNTMDLQDRTSLCDRVYGCGIIEVEADVNTNIAKKNSDRLTLAKVGSHENDSCVDIVMYVGTDEKLHRWVPEIGGYGKETALRQIGYNQRIALMPVKTDVCNIMEDNRKVLVQETRFNESECHDILFPAGADVNILNHAAIMWVIRKAYGDYINTLTAAGDDVNYQNTDGTTALMRAVQTGHYGSIQILIAAGADVNIKNKFGETALLMAPYWCESKIYELLIQAGADVNIIARNGDTVMRRILRSPWKTIEKLKMVYSAGANVNMINVDGVIVIKDRMVKMEILKLLFVAGENIDGAGYLAERVKSELNLESESSMIHLWRNAIREHLLRMSNTNLFYRVPRLGLPATLQKIVLFDISLEDF